MSDYTKINWNNTDTPISSINLDKMDNQIKILSDKFPIFPMDVSEDVMSLPRKNLLNILKLKLQMALSSSDIDAWSDILADNSLINDGLSSFYSVSNGSLVVKTNFEVTNSPLTAISDNTSGGAAWANPDGVYAEHSEDSKVASVGYVDGSGFQYLKASNYGFSIPLNATIKGIQVDVKKGDLSSWEDLETYDLGAYIIKSSGIFGVQNKAYPYEYKWQSISLNPTYSNYVCKRSYTPYGGSTDLWGESWTPEDINSSNFGFAIQPAPANQYYTPIVDHIKITIYYSVPNPTATIIWNSVTPSEALTYIALTSDQSFTNGTINWYISQNGTNWTQITSLDALQAVNFTTNSLHLKCTMTGDAKVDAIAYGGY